MKNFIKTKAPVLGIYHVTALMAAILVAFTACTEEDDFIAIADISVVPTVAEVNIPLTLTSTVSPSDATNKAIAWSVKNAGTTGASVSGNTMTATATGAATLTATNDASKNTPFIKDFSIMVSPYYRRQICNLVSVTESSDWWMCSTDTIPVISRFLFIGISSQGRKRILYGKNGKNNQKIINYMLWNNTEFQKV